jgi:thiosulfate reductase cytochrome b subunit
MQQLTYFGVVFLLGPFMIATGSAMSSAIDARFPRYPKIFGGDRQQEVFTFWA